MSIVPNDKLQSADSLTLRTFGIDFPIEKAFQSIDIYSLHRSFWKSAIVRNLQPSDILEYRTNPNDLLQVIQANSELPLKGWGSYLEIVSPLGTSANGIINFECVRLEEALIK